MSDTVILTQTQVEWLKEKASNITTCLSIFETLQVLWQCLFCVLRLFYCDSIRCTQFDSIAESRPYIFGWYWRQCWRRIPSIAWTLFHFPGSDKHQCHSKFSVSSRFGYTCPNTNRWLQSVWEWRNFGWRLSEKWRTSCWPGQEHYIVGASRTNILFTL